LTQYLVLVYISLAVRYLTVPPLVLLAIFMLLVINPHQSVAEDINNMPSPSPIEEDLIATASASPSATPKIKKVSTSSAKPKPTKAAISPRELLVQSVNEYRNSLGLPTVKIDNYSCNFAKERAKEIAEGGFNHDGFSNRVNAGNLPYPGYSNIVENIARTNGVEDVVEIWKNSPLHAENMRADTLFVCIENYGNFYVYEGWKP
jgi:uncharacterized protein YkwD